MRKNRKLIPMAKAYLIVVMLSIMSVSVSAIDTDSLKQKIQTAEGLNKTELQLLLSENLLDLDVNQSLAYSRLVFKSCEDKQCQINALGLMMDAFRKLKRYDSVDAHVEKALELSYTLNNDELITKYLPLRGWKYFYAGDYKKAANDFKATHRMFNKLLDSEHPTFVIDSNRFAIITNNLGAVYTKMGKYDSAIYYFYLSLEYKKKYQAPPFAIINSMVNLSGLNLHKQDYLAAKTYAIQAMDIAEDIKDSINMARCLINLGICEKNIGDSVQALYYYHRALDIGKAKKRRKTISSALTNLGLIYLQNKEWAKAGRYLRESLEFNKDSHNKSSYCNILSNMANYYTEVCKYDSAIYYAQKSLVLSKEIGDVQITENNYRLLAISYAEIKNYKQAYNYSILHKQLHDSSFNIESSARFDELQTKYKSVESDKQIFELNYNVEVQKRQKMQLRWVIGGILFLFVFALIMFVFKRKKDKQIHQKEQLVLTREKELTHAELEKSYLKEQELKNEIQYKSKQLTTHALNMMQKNTLMQEIQDELVVLSKHASEENKGAFNRLKMLIKKNLRSENDWDLFKLYFEDVNKEFYKDLARINSDLTSNDLKLSALLKLNMNIKECASVMNIEPASVKTARYKLRKKLGLKPDDDLVEVIRNIG